MLTRLLCFLFLFCINMIHAKIIEVGGVNWKLDESEEKLVVKLGDQFTLTMPLHADPANITWYFNRDYSKIDTLYENQTINAQFADLIECLPSDDQCESLVVKTLTGNMVGEYAFRSSEDSLANISYNYLLTGYNAPLKIESSFCSYTQSSNVFLCRDNYYQVTYCRAPLLKHAPYRLTDATVKLELSKCDESTEQTPSGIGNTLYSSCYNRFSTSDESISCSFKYINGKEIDKSDHRVEIGFGPEMPKNETASYLKRVSATEGDEVKLKCLYDGYPITYMWTAQSSAWYKSEREITLPRTLTPGTYYYSCKPIVRVPSGSGDYGIEGFPMDFIVDIKRVQTASKDEPPNNFPLIIGLSIGGILLGVALLLGYLAFTKFTKDKRKEHSVVYSNTVKL